MRGGFLNSKGQASQCVVLCWGGSHDPHSRSLSPPPRAAEPEQIVPSAGPSVLEDHRWANRNWVSPPAMGLPS
ncbi:hypothetical protein NL676_028824 [Syzygium grande]|nr:hypothetical protein NL676_028824 [Syzygium grande]